MTMTESRKAREKLALECPGLVGDVTKQILKRALYPIPTFACATALATIGTFRSSYRRTTKRLNTPSNLFFCCLAGTGSGKDFPRAEMKRVVEESCAGLPIEYFVADEFRSAQGVHLDCAQSGAVKVFLHDEAHTFFYKASKKEDTHTKDVKSLLTKLFGKQNDSYRAGQVVGKSGHLPTLWWPSIGYVGFGVPTALGDIFTQEDSKGGWLNRMILIVEDMPIGSLLDVIERPDSEDKNSPYKFQMDDRWISLIHHTIEAAQLRKSEKMPKLSFEILDFDAPGFKLYKKFLGHHKAERAYMHESKISDYRERFEEYVLRVASALTDDGCLIGYKEIDWAWCFLDLCMREVAEHFEAAQDKANPVIQRIERELDRAGAAGILRSELLKRIGRISAGEVKSLLDVLSKEGKAHCEMIPSESGKGRKGETWFAVHHFDTLLEQKRNSFLEDRGILTTFDNSFDTQKTT